MRRLLGLGLPRGRRAKCARSLRPVRGEPVSTASCLYEGSVRHRRLESGLRDEFRHRLFMAYLDLDELPELFDGRPLWSARGPALAWFRRADYLGTPDVPLADSVRALVAERTGTRPRGPIRILTHLRCFGHCFNPVSFYYCFETGGPGAPPAPPAAGRRGERLSALVADVTNTPWGESHAYVLPVAHRPGVVRGSFEKQLHVSPLMGMGHSYELRATEPGERLSVHISSTATGASAPAFDATLSLERRELSSGLLARYPFLTVRILARIYAHALRLRARGAVYHPHPPRGAAPA
ncbi:MAG: DUF1365 domain-containing protein [Solirubrobacteraceae bacterium]